MLEIEQLFSQATGNKLINFDNKYAFLLNRLHKLHKSSNSQVKCIWTWVGRHGCHGHGHHMSCHLNMFHNG